MSHLPKFNRDVNYCKEYIENRVSTSKNVNLETLVDSQTARQFDGIIKQKYISKAKRNVVRRNYKVAVDPLFQDLEFESSDDLISNSSFVEDVVFEGGDNHSESKNESSRITKRTRSRSQMRVKKKMKLMGSFRKPKITAKKGPKRSLNAMTEEDHITQDIYDHAIDMYIQENGKTLRYKGIDEDLVKNDDSDSDDSFHSDLDSDESFNEDVDFDETIDYEYEQMPTHDGIKYISPLFKHKYELSIWKAGIYCTKKVKNTYFTPESSKISKSAFNEFDMEISLDKQTLIIFEKENKTEQALILIIDVYTLDKIIELDVNTCNKLAIKTLQQYDQNEDFYNPTSGKYCPTAQGLQRFQCWNNGEYLLVGVGAFPDSKKISSFDLYDTTSKSKIATYDRLKDRTVKGEIRNYYVDPNESNIIYFLTFYKNAYIYYMIDLFEDESEIVCSIKGSDIVMLKVSEDLDSIFVVLNETTNEIEHEHSLYVVPFGDSVNFNRDDMEPF